MATYFLSGAAVAYTGFLCLTYRYDRLCQSKSRVLDLLEGKELVRKEKKQISLGRFVFRQYKENICVAYLRGAQAIKNRL